jgi:hypothetical protein
VLTNVHDSRECFMAGGNFPTISLPPLSQYPHTQGSRFIMSTQYSARDELQLPKKSRRGCLPSLGWLRVWRLNPTQPLRCPVTVGVWQSMFLIGMLGLRGQQDPRRTSSMAVVQPRTSSCGLPWCLHCYSDELPYRTSDGADSWLYNTL